MRKKNEGTVHSQSKMLKMIPQEHLYNKSGNVYTENTLHKDNRIACKERLSNKYNANRIIKIGWSVS